MSGCHTFMKVCNMFANFVIKYILWVATISNVTNTLVLNEMDSRLVNRITLFTNVPSMIKIITLVYYLQPCSWSTYDEMILKLHRLYCICNLAVKTSLLLKPIKTHKIHIVSICRSCIRGHNEHLRYDK